MTAEAGKILINEIIEFIAGKYSLILHQTHITLAVDNFGTHVPQGRITHKESAVVKKRGFHRFPVIIVPVFLYEFYRLGIQQTYKRVRLRGLLCGHSLAGEKQQDDERQSSWNFVDHPGSLNSQSRKRGSMII